MKMEIYKNDSLLTYIIINFIRYVPYKSVNTLKYYWGKTRRLTNYAPLRSPAFWEIKSRLNSKQFPCLPETARFRPLVYRSQNLNKTWSEHSTVKTYVVNRFLTKLVHMELIPSIQTVLEFKRRDTTLNPYIQGCW